MANSKALVKKRSKRRRALKKEKRRNLESETGQEVDILSPVIQNSGNSVNESELDLEGSDGIISELNTSLGSLPESSLSEVQQSSEATKQEQYKHVVKLNYQHDEYRECAEAHLNDPLIMGFIEWRALERRRKCLEKMNFSNYY